MNGSYTFAQPKAVIPMRDTVVEASTANESSRKGSRIAAGIPNLYGMSQTAAVSPTAFAPCRRRTSSPGGRRTARTARPSRTSCAASPNVSGYLRDGA